MFSVGSVVQLKSGGVTMTVSNSIDAIVECTWFTPKGDLKSASFAPTMLKQATRHLTLEELITGDTE